jgi:hypothetical protein
MHIAPAWTILRFAGFVSKPFTSLATIASGLGK